jgi:hypothetical protein
MQFEGQDRKEFRQDEEFDRMHPTCRPVALNRRRKRRVRGRGVQAFHPVNPVHPVDLNFLTEIVPATSFFGEMRHCV